MYFQGQGCVQNYEKAAHWFRKAALEGNISSQYSLGLMYYNGEVTQDYSEAFKWIQLATNGGSKRARYHLGLCYRDGHGVSQDFAKAFELFRDGASEGHLESMSCLGDAYCQGEGIAVEAELGVEWYQKAADHGGPIAQINLGRCYLHGIGVGRDVKMAEKWLRLASTNGNKDAERILSEKPFLKPESIMQYLSKFAADMRIVQMWILCVTAVLAGIIVLFPNRVAIHSREGDNIRADLGHSFIFSTPTWQKCYIAINRKPPDSIPASTAARYQSFVDFKRTGFLLVALGISTFCVYVAAELYRR